MTEWLTPAHAVLTLILGILTLASTIAVKAMKPFQWLAHRELKRQESHAAIAAAAVAKHEAETDRIRTVVSEELEPIRRDVCELTKAIQESTERQAEHIKDSVAFEREMRDGLAAVKSDGRVVKARQEIIGQFINVEFPDD